MGVEQLMDLINKTFGNDIMFSPANSLGIHDIPRFSTGSLKLDIDSGGGWPEGKMIEIYGPESSGKTFLIKQAFAIITNREEKNKALLIDEEGDYTNEWSKSIGVNIDNLTIVRSKFAEQSLDIMEMAVRSGEFSIVVLDSIAALIPKKELEGSTEDDQMGLQARLMGKLCRKMYRAIDESRKKGTKCTVFFINQMRFKIGVVYGNPEVTPGGYAVKYASAIRLDIRRKEKLFDSTGEEVIGQKSSYTFVKNKTAPPLKKGEFEFSLVGNERAKINNFVSLIECGLSINAIEKAGSWYKGDWLSKKIQGVKFIQNDLKSQGADKLNLYIDEYSKIAMNGSNIEFRFKDKELI